MKGIDLLNKKNIIEHSIPGYEKSKETKYVSIYKGTVVKNWEKQRSIKKKENYLTTNTSYKRDIHSSRTNTSDITTIAILFKERKTES